MRYLIKPSIYSHMCEQHTMNVTEEQFYMSLIKRPYMGDKYTAKNIIIGELVDNPRTLDGDIWCGADNVKSISALMLDYDDHISIEEFCNRYGEFIFYGYTSYNHFRYKAHGKADRFRIIIPLDRPIPMKYWGTAWIKKPLIKYFDGADSTCFDRGHWQVVPVCENPKSYMYFYNTGNRFTLDLLKRDMLKLKMEYDLKAKQRAFELDNREHDEDYDRDAHIENFVSKFIEPEIDELDMNSRNGGRNVNQRLGKLFGRMMSHPKIEFYASEVAEILMNHASDPLTIRDIKGWEKFFENN